MLKICQLLSHLPYELVFQVFEEIIANLTTLEFCNLVQSQSNDSSLLSPIIKSILRHSKITIDQENGISITLQNKQSLNAMPINDSRPLNNLVSFMLHYGYKVEELMLANVKDSMLAIVTTDDAIEALIDHCCQQFTISLLHVPDIGPHLRYLLKANGVDFLCDSTSCRPLLESTAKLEHLSIKLSSMNEAFTYDKLVSILNWLDHTVPKSLVLDLDMNFSSSSNMIPKFLEVLMHRNVNFSLNLPYAPDTFIQNAGPLNNHIEQLYCVVHSDQKNLAWLKTITNLQTLKLNWFVTSGACQLDMSNSQLKKMVLTNTPAGSEILLKVFG
ncbi:unnamed protein product [Ambrosiozyma monospora]|uniref:Unnamed protein product n=1 Tax=Ambrosiozyma monospora TaxID=43982 RepID=A0A9W6Z414_AMBMO|nr:unnamed protein product [Ambrosiozyma monospora]